MTCALAALALVGPLARDVLARLTAIDLRPDCAPEASFRPGSVARIPGMVLRERGERYVLMFGSAYAQYMWMQVTDAAEPLDGVIVGADALAAVRRRGAGRCLTCSAPAGCGDRAPSCATPTTW